MASKIDLVQLAKEIRQISIRSKLYQVLKTELDAIDHWKQQSRGLHVNRNKRVKKNAKK